MEGIDKAKKIINEASNIVAFTGAGASTESNIPDFRSDSGLYSGNKKYPYPPETMLSHTFFNNHTEMFYDFYKKNMVYTNALPNKCHFGLAKLERQGKLKAVVTQNIDGLHQAAGSRSVLELHGSVQRNYCTKCKKAFDLNYIMNKSDEIPHCDICSSIVKPDVVLYEEMLDGNVLKQAAAAIRAAEVLLVIGTSLVVYPAAGLLDYYRGNKLILINRTSTPYDYRAEVVLYRNVGEVMEALSLV